MGGFPRLYAAASLKRVGSREGGDDGGGFSAALCRGLIEAFSPCDLLPADVMFSAALCRGLIEAPGAPAAGCGRSYVFRGFMPRPH